MQCVLAAFLVGDNEDDNEGYSDNEDDNGDRGDYEDGSDDTVSRHM